MTADRTEPTPGAATAASRYIPPRTQPSPFWAVAFTVAVLAAFVVVILNAARIDALGAQTVAPPCRLAPGQIAHITVRLDDGELIAQCLIVKGRS